MLTVPVEANVVDTPLTGLPYASFRVNVTIEVATPSAVNPPLGEAEMLEFAATIAPATKVTVPPDLLKGVAMFRVFVSALVEVSAQVEIPDPLLAEHAP